MPPPRPPLARRMLGGPPALRVPVAQGDPASQVAPAGRVLRLAVCVAVAVGMLPLAIAEEETTFRLANGLTVVLQPRAQDSGIAIALVLAVGEDHDAVNRAGWAQFIGAIAVPDGWQVRVAGTYSAFTRVVEKAELEGGLAAVARRLTGRRSPGDIAAVKVWQALRAREEQKPAESFRADLRARLGPAAPAGSMDAPPPLSAELEERLRQQFAAANATLALVGAFDPATARERCEALLGAMPAGDPLPAPRAGGATAVAAAEIVAMPMPDAWAGGPPILCRVSPGPTSRDQLFPAFLAIAATLKAACNPPPVQSPPGTAQPRMDFDLLEDPVLLALTLRHGLAGQEDGPAYLERFLAENAQPASVDAVVRAFPELMADVADGAPGETAIRLARRAQLGIDRVTLRRALEGLLPEAAGQARERFFAPATARWGRYGVGW